MTFERFMVACLTAFVVWTLGGIFPAVIATNHGQEWALVAWAVPVFVLVVGGVITVLVILWKETS